MDHTPSPAAPASAPRPPRSTATSVAPAKFAVRRVPLLLLGGASLLMGLAGGLARIGSGMPSPQSAAVGHGVLMALGFLGTLITLERSVAMGRSWGFATPVLSGLGAVLLVAGAPSPVPELVLTAAGAWLTAVYVVMWQMQQAPHIAVQLLGALAWWGAGVRWLTGGSLSQIAPWLAGFLVLTIVGERLELSRFAIVGRTAGNTMLAASGVLSLGMLVGLADADAGARVFGLALVLFGLWATRFDLIRRTIHTPGLTRYMAVCMAAGYAWLSVAGLLWMVHGSVTDGPVYDAALHAVFLGFAMSMVFGHAPVILPAVLRIRLPHHGRDYVVLAILHASLLLRLGLGDGLGLTPARILGGILGAIALLAFVANSAFTAAAASRAPAPRRPVSTTTQPERMPR
ncbi:MAG TPA: hypothetical protein VLC50_01405 [Actinomycetes bacterium]|nr:hypothetical protein [Actinomycetes bacterium]